MLSCRKVIKDFLAMARMYPEYDDIDSHDFPSGEVKLYKALKEIDDSYHIFHTVTWITKNANGAKDGEADFLICHPEKGILVVEVKGGRISANYRQGLWLSTDRHGREHEIKDPFRQATNAKFNILEKLRENPDWQRARMGRINIGHSVFFPDVDTSAGLKGPDAHIEIIGDRGAFLDLQSWVERALDFWASEEVGSKLGSNGIAIIEKIFARVVTAKPLLSKKLEFEELERLRLTEQQITVLNTFSRVRRAVVNGGAGTGKTVLAVEKAKRLAEEGFSTLLTCYNVPLSEHLEKICEGIPNLQVSGFHKLCKRTVQEAKEISQRDFLREMKEEYPNQDEWTYQLPNALAMALDVVELSFDAIVVDEGQDFGEEFWLPIEVMLNSSRASPLYIFQDENQDVYNRVSSFPNDLVPVSLTFNCRNTKKIHDAAYKFYNGEDIEPPKLEGSDIVILEDDDINKQAKKIRDYVSSLLISEKVNPADISVLIANSYHRKKYEKILNSLPLHSSYAWCVGGSEQSNTVNVETVARFKGLESKVVVLWGIDDLHSVKRNETLYVGLSRAKSIVAVCGSKPIMREIFTHD